MTTQRGNTDAPGLRQLVKLRGDVPASWHTLMRIPGIRDFTTRPRRDANVEVLPGLDSRDPRFLKAMEEAVDALQNELPPVNLDNGLVGPNGIPSNHAKLLTVAGALAHPLDIPAVTNLAERKKLGLADKWVHPEHERIARTVARFFFEGATPAPLHMRAESNMMAPDFSADPDRKMGALLKMLDNADKVFECVKKNDFVGLFNELSALFLSCIVTRKQADGCTFDARKRTWSSKQREVKDELAARAADGKTGHWAPADKTVYDKSGAIIDGHFAMRVRVAHGYNFQLNYFIASFLSVFREHYLNEFGYTYKHRTPESMADKLARFSHYVCFDVTRMDTTIGFFQFQPYIDEASAAVNPEFGKIIEYMIKTAYISPYPYHPNDAKPDSFDPTFGDPMNPHRSELQFGLPSGISPNPDLGKYVMTVTYLCVMFDHYGVLPDERIRSILRGEDPEIGLLDASDDCVFGMNDPVMHKAWTGAQVAPNAKGTWVKTGDSLSPYMKLGSEPGSFLGNVMIANPNARVQSRPVLFVPNLTTYFSNWYVPESSITARSRLNTFAIGWAARQRHYSTAPAFQLGLEVFDRAFEKHVHQSPSSFISPHLAVQRARLGNISFADISVMTNPGLLHSGKFALEDLSPQFRASLGTSVPSSVIWSVVSRYIDSARHISEGNHQRYH